MRIAFDLPELTHRYLALERDFRKVAGLFSMDWQLTRATAQKRIAIFVSREDHCLLELLWQLQAGDLQAKVSMVISNHLHLRKTVESWGLPYHYIPVRADAKHVAEEAQQTLLENQIDLVVLARYMQILSSDFVKKWPHRIINIHHSFLPAFVGAAPYRQASERGVKLIGATAHYVTESLDAGPIIEQDVQRVDHRHSIEDLKRIGRHIERVVLARAVSWHVDDRVLVNDNKCVVFS